MELYRQAREGFYLLCSLLLEPHWARTHLHREVLREVSRCRHAALDRMLHRPTETYMGDPEHCREMDDSPDDPGVANAWDSPERGAFGGAPCRGA